jgi:hypothetical protein
MLTIACSLFSLQDIPGIDYQDNASIMAQISESWWLKHESCKHMLAILVYKDNKEILSNPTKLPPGDTRRVPRKNEVQAMADERATTKADCPIKKYSDIDHQMKKARVNGMCSQIEKNLVKSIVSQIIVMPENEQIYKSMLGKLKYQEKIVQLINKLPGLATTDEVPESVGMTKDDDNDNSVGDGGGSDSETIFQLFV